MKENPVKFVKYSRYRWIANGFKLMYLILSLVFILFITLYHEDKRPTPVDDLMIIIMWINKSRIPSRDVLYDTRILYLNH